MNLQEIVSKKQSLAREYARIAHDDEGQIRKGTGERYWKHTQGVADILEGYGETDEDILCAAELHDTAEDTAVNFQDIEDYFGQKVVDIVSEITNNDDEITHLKNTKYKGQEKSKVLAKEEYMNRKLIHLSIPALKIKLADFYYNSADKPGTDQLARMKKNIEFLKSHRKSILKNDIIRRLIHALETVFGYNS